MCGIAGYNLSPNDSLDATRLARGLLLAIEHRGRHATGAAWCDEAGKVWYDKDGVSATAYVPRLALSPLALSAVLHTRFATQGSPSDNGNNHPIALPGITGTHNGCLDNDGAIFDLLGVEREAEVDSEAIFALLAYGSDLPTPGEALELVEGDAAVAWIETARPRTLHLARLTGRPLAIGRTAGGSLVYASTPDCLVEGCKAAGVTLNEVREVAEGTYLRVLRGEVKTVERFTPAGRPSRSYRPSRTYPGYASGGWESSGGSPSTSSASTSSSKAVTPIQRIGDAAITQGRS